VQDIANVHRLGLELEAAHLDLVQFARQVDHVDHLLRGLLNQTQLRCVFGVHVISVGQALHHAHNAGQRTFQVVAGDVVGVFAHARLVQHGVVVQLQLAPHVDESDKVAHPGAQCLGIIGFRNKIDGTKRHSLDAGLVVGQSRDKDDRNLSTLRFLTETAHHLETVHARHQHIHQDQVRHWFKLTQCQGCGTVGGGQHLVLILEQLFKQLETHRVIVHDQNTRRRQHRVGVRA